MEPSGCGSEETPNSSEGVFWVGLCCIVIEASQVLQSRPVAQLVLVLVTNNNVTPVKPESQQEDIRAGDDAALSVKDWSSW